MTSAVRRAVTIWTVVGWCVVVWLVLAGPSAGQEDNAPDAATLDLYAAQCAPCHGATGEGGIAPALTSGLGTLEERQQIIADGFRGMPSFSQALAPSEIEELAALLDTFVVAATYVEQCAPCHGNVGEGGVGPSLLGHQVPIEEQLVIMREGRGAMPAFGSILDDDELVAIIDYVSGLAATEIVGEELYVTQCAPCHGLEGEGGVGPGLQQIALTPQEMAAIISFGTGTMPTFGGTLSQEQIEAVAAFSQSLRASPLQDAPPEADTRGAELFAQQCSGCHGQGGSGGSGPALVGTPLSTESLVATITDGVGSMPSFGASLSAEDIEAIASWLRADSPAADDRLAQIARGATVFTARCAECHGLDASGDVGPALTATALTTEETAAVITAGRAGMPAFGEILATDDITALSLFIEAAAAAAGPEVVPARTTATEGQAIFRSNCATCHGADATGGVAPALTTGKLTANEIVSQVYGGHGLGMPAFEGVLTGDQVQEVARFVTSLPETGGGGLSGSTIALLIGLALAAVVAGLWASGRIGTPPPEDEAIDGGPWQPPWAPEDERPPES